MHTTSSHRAWTHVVAGFSFRRKSFALACLAISHAGGMIDEDVLFSSCIDRGMGRSPNSARELARFCTQKNFLDKSMGAHMTKNEDFNASALAEFLLYCPEAVLLRDWNKR